MNLTGSATPPEFVERKDIIRTVKKIELFTRAYVEGLQPGIHQSLFKGQGIEFSEIREYVPGDDVRSIDWKVSARFNRPFIKEFSEERDQTFYFVVDISGSGSFGSETTKRRKMLEVVASLSFAALRNNDRIGLCLFSDRVERFLPARRGRKHLVALLNTLIDHLPGSQGTDIGSALRFLSHTIARKSSIMLISDFMSPDYSRPLRVLRRHHEVIAIRITDPREQDLPDIGLVELEDPETGEQVLVDTSDPGFRERYRALVADAGAATAAVFLSTGTSHVALRTNEPYEIPLRRFFGRMRKGRSARGRIL